MAKPQMLKLKPHIKFRKERSYILLCDCKKIENYELSLKYYSSVVALKRGVAKSKIKDKLVKDLVKIGAINQIKS